MAKKKKRGDKKSKNEKAGSSEEDRRKSKGKKKKSSKRKASTDSSDSSESSSSSASSVSSTSSGADSSSSESSSEEDKKGKKKKRKTVDMELLDELWPTEDRPTKLRKARGIGGLSMSKLMQLKEQFEKESEKKGMGAAVYGRDRKPKAKKFKEMKDDGEKKLHPARFESMPRAEPSKWWQMVPTSRSEIYRHVPLEHIGVEGVPETTIVKLHNRKVPVELSMLYREVSEVRHVQVAVYNFVALLRSLHPADHGGLVIMNVLINAGWAENIGENEKQRVQLMRRFFDDMVRENSGRAVRREPPLDPEQGKARWLKAVAAVMPHLSLLGVGQQMAAMGAAGAKQPKGGKGGKSGGPIGGGGQGGGGGQMAGKQGAGGGGRPAAAAGGPPARTPARFNGMPVCFGFNNAAGCSRIPPGTTAKNCVDGNTSFAHVCNYWVKGPGGQGGAHCLAGHSKTGNH